MPKGIQHKLDTNCYLPTEEEIAAAAQELRKKWGPQKAATHTTPDNVPWEVPNVGGTPKGKGPKVDPNG